MLDPQGMKKQDPFRIGCSRPACQPLPFTKEKSFAPYFALTVNIDEPNAPCPTMYV